MESGSSKALSRYLVDVLGVESMVFPERLEIEVPDAGGRDSERSENPEASTQTSDDASAEEPTAARVQGQTSSGENFRKSLPVFEYFKTGVEKVLFLNIDEEGIVENQEGLELLQKMCAAIQINESFCLVEKVSSSKGASLGEMLGPIIEGLSASGEVNLKNVEATVFVSKNSKQRENELSRTFVDLPSPIYFISHPGELLRRPELKRPAWETLKALKSDLSLS